MNRPRRIAFIGVGLLLVLKVVAEERDARAALLDPGLLDVTAAPFLADPTGIRDSTAAIQAAVTQAAPAKLAVYLPPGVYKVSDTIEYALWPKGSGEPNVHAPCFILGSRRGATRPKILLAPHSPGFGDPEKPKSVIHLWARSRFTNRDEPQPNINYYQLIVGIDIEIGPNNPGAIGIHHDAAQGSGIEDVTVWAGDGHAGIVGLQAGGGGTHNVTVIGGRFGLDAAESRATAATISGATFIGQRESAFRYGGLETCCLVGARILAPAGAKGPAIQGVGTGATRGTMAIIDTQVVFEAEGPDNVAVESTRSVYVNNLWAKNAAKLVQTTDGGTLGGNPAGWRQVAEFGHGVTPPPIGTRLGEVQLQHVSYLDGRRQIGNVLVAGADGKAPPADLQSRHIWKDVPTWEDPAAADVRAAPFFAKGDGKTDDTKALQDAIDTHDLVFLPKGEYAVTKTLQLRPNTKLVGLRHQSVIRGQCARGNGFDRKDSGAAIIRSADDAEGTAALLYITIAAGEGMEAPLLHWRTGRHSAVRSIILMHGREYQEHWPVRVTDHGGGRWFSLYRAARMHVEGTTEPLRIYHANPEWGRLPHMWLQRAKDFTIYGLKEEGYRSISIEDSDRINVFGYGGIANAHAGKSLFEVARTPNFRLVGLLDRVVIVNEKMIASPPGKWHMVAEIAPDGSVVRTEPHDRIVLYRRGYNANAAPPPRD